MTPYYDEGGITIYCGDSREILPTLGTFDLTLTDPPYGSSTRTNYPHRNTTRRSHGALPRQKDHLPVTGDDVPFDPRPLLALAPACILWGANHYASRLPDSPFWLAWDRVTDGTTSTNVELAWVGGHRFRTVRRLVHQWCGVRRASESGKPSLHPTQKPVALMAWCLSFFPEARTVVDPYMGSGPVAKACADAGLRYVGIELVEAYCERSVARLAQRSLTA